MNREIKFRAWEADRMIPWEEIENGSQNYLAENFKAMSEYAGVILMQFTGLKDKNGKEIYEGDVVKRGQRVFTKFYVLWWGNKSCFVLSAFPEKINGWVKLTKRLCDSRIEVIGNIYENSDLTQPHENK